MSHDKFDESFGASTSAGIRDIALISHPDCLLHKAGYEHPEQPERLRVIEETLLSSYLADSIQTYQAPLVSKEQLMRVHDKSYVEKIFHCSPSSGFVELDPDTHMNPYTLQAALRAAGAVIYAVDLVMSGEVKTAFCNIRPPGHHAERSRAMGFCIFNNVAIGVAHALTKYKLKRVAIIDFDVHHGNGTENIFQEEQRVLFCSIFQYPLYPMSGIESRNNHILNIPLSAGATGKEFRSEIDIHWLDQIKEFEPELIFFSAGFDGHYKDPISSLQLTEFDYAWLTHQIKEIADHCCSGRMVSSLEGGYTLDVLGSCVLAHLDAMIDLRP